MSPSPHLLTSPLMTSTWTQRPASALPQYTCREQRDINGVRNTWMVWTQRPASALLQYTCREQHEAKIVRNISQPRHAVEMRSCGIVTTNTSSPLLDITT